MRFEAIINLRPDALFTMQGETLEWLDEVQTKPTEQEILDEMIILQANYISNEYSRLRKVEYAKLEQDEMRWDDQLNGTTTWFDAVAAIKLAIPKPV